MMPLDQILPFLAAAILITLSPGPDNLMVLTLGISRGRLAGMVFGLGCALGCLSHTLLAAIGISALIAASPLAFGLLKFAGGAYLIWLGWQAIRSTGSSVGNRADKPERLLTLFSRGLIANAINPKVVLFFLAFLPQFIPAGSSNIAGQTVLLGSLFTLQAAILFGLLGFFAGHAGAWLQGDAKRAIYLDRIAGTVFIALGARLVLTP